MPGLVRKNSEKGQSMSESKLSLAAKTKALDPALSSLFASSAGPVKASAKKVVTPAAVPKSKPKPKPTEIVPDPTDEEDALEEQDDEELSEASQELDYGTDDEDIAEDDDYVAEVEVETEKPSRKRKQRDTGDVEDEYLKRLAREEAKEEEQLRKLEKTAKRQKREQSPEASDVSSEHADDAEAMDEDEDFDAIPQHESLEPTKDEHELDKANRTVFLSNVSTDAIRSKTSKKTLMNHLSSFLVDLTKQDTPHKVESIRFRSTAYSSHVPKKAAFARKDIMDETTHTTNAYAVYTTKIAAIQAAKRLNGTVVLGRHLRVDSVAHPAKVDHRRCVFVGNLGFVDDETNIVKNDEGRGNIKHRAQNGDVEEGLWQQFGKAGTVESVRVPRDPKTRIGKGFAYVQFVDPNAVEAALLFNDKKYPPLLPRKLRVSRAKRNKPSHGQGRPGEKSGRPLGGGKPQGKANPEQQTQQGRVRKLLGRAAAAGMRTDKPGGKPFKTPEAFVFEGHRASSSQGNRGLKLGGSGKKKGGRPRDRSAKRAAAWKANTKDKGSKQKA